MSKETTITQNFYNYGSAPQIINNDGVIVISNDKKGAKVDVHMEDVSMPKTSTNCKKCKFGAIIRTGSGDGSYTKCTKVNKGGIFINNGVMICDGFEDK